MELLTYQPEVLDPDASVRVIGASHPLRGRDVNQRVPAGLSITEILDRVRRTTKFPHLVLVWIDGEPVPREWWSRVRPKPGTTVIFRCIVQGSNINAILGLAVAIGAALLAGPLAGFLFPALAAGSLGLSLATAAVGAGLLVGGTLAVNALFPVRPAQLNSDALPNTTNLASIQGGQNESNPYGAIPVVLGKHRFSPTYAAKPYTEISGGDQWLRLLFCWGYGPLTIDTSTLKIGDTPLTDFDNFQIEHFEGEPTDTAPTLFPSQVDEEELAITITSSGGGQIRTTGENADEISVDLTCPQGIYVITPTTGSGVAVYSINVRLEYRLVGDVSWTLWTNITLSSHGLNAFRQGATLNVTRGQYEVRVTKTTGDQNNSNVKEQLVWTAIRSFTKDPPVTFSHPLALTALRIKATDQLSGLLNTFNGIITSRAKVFSGSPSSWIDDTATQNPADLFRLVLQSPANIRAVDDSQIDFTSLEAWWQYCVDNGFKFNQVRDRASIYDTLSDIAASGRATVTFVDGKWGVVWDRPNDPVVQHFTPRNSWALTGSHPYLNLPHGFRVRFINEDNEYTSDERIVYDDGYDAGNATLFESIEFPGVTDPDLIWKHGRFHIAQTRLRTEQISFSTDWEHLVATRGDRVRLTHDVMLIGVGSGRVKAVNDPVITLDEPIIMAGGSATYGIRFRTADGTSIFRSVDSSSGGEFTDITLLGVSSPDTLPEVGDLWAFGLTDQESAVYRVYGIEHQTELVARITLVDDAQAISSADTGVIPAYDPHITIGADPFALPPQDLDYAELVDGAGASTRAVIRLSWKVARAGNVVSFEVQSRNDFLATMSAPAPWVREAVVPMPHTTYDVPLINTGSWGFRVRSIFNDNTTSAWTTLEVASLEGLPTSPDDLTNVRVTYISGRMHITWDPIIDDPRDPLYEVRKGASWTSGLVVGDALKQPPFQTVGDDTYWLAAFVVSPFGTRVYSVNPQSITVSGSVLTDNVVVSFDEKASGWPGLTSGTLGVDSGLNALRTGSSSGLITFPDELGSVETLGGVLGGVYVSNTVVDAGRVNRCRVTVDYSAVGVPTSPDFLGDPDFLNNPDIFASLLTSLIRAYPIIRTSTTSIVAFKDELLHTFTANGNAFIDTAHTRGGDAAGAFDGSGDFASASDSADFTLGSGDFTIQIWVGFRTNSNAGDVNFAGQVDAAGYANANSAWGLSTNAATKVFQFKIVSGTTVTTVTGTSGAALNRWYHIAVVRTGNTLKMFVNGVQEGGDVAFSSTVNDSTATLAVGRAGALATGQTLDGWLDEFELAPGTARFTSNFTPSQDPIVSDAFTKVLMHFDAHTWGEWQKWSPDVYLARYFQLGMVLALVNDTSSPDVSNPFAYCLGFAWTVDVPDRLDRYQNLSVPASPDGLTIVFEEGGYDTTPTGITSAFIGGPNNATVPHITSTYLDAPTGYRVIVSNITKSSVVVNVKDSSGVGQAAVGVNIFAQGY